MIAARGGRVPLFDLAGEARRIRRRRALAMRIGSALLLCALVLSIAVLLVFAAAR